MSTITSFEVYRLHDNDGKLRVLFELLPSGFSLTVFNCHDEQATRVFIDGHDCSKWHRYELTPREVQHYRTLEPKEIHG